MPATPRKLFVSLAVRDLEQSREFFAGLGFAFNPTFSDNNAACMIVSDEASFMLLREPYFKGFTTRAPCDTSRHTEAFLAISCETRAEVDEILNKALALGGQRAMPPIDHGFMYLSSFYDLDGHHWEVFWMNPAHRH